MYFANAPIRWSNQVKTPKFAFPMMAKRISFAALLFVFSLSSSAQFFGYKPFERKPGFLITPTYSYQVPGKDMATRFGNNSSIGLGLVYKMPKGWIGGLEYNWLFGQRVKETGLFDTIIGSTGQIIDENGNFSVVRFNERGHTFFVKGGKIIPFNKVNLNSGFLVEAGFGFMMHKIDIFSSQVTIPQLSEEYLKGYDRLTGGWAAKQFIGYQNLDPRKRINFIIGVELVEGWTHSLRSYNFDTRVQDTHRRFDLLMGIKAGITIPIYTKDPDEEEYFTD